MRSSDPVRVVRVIARLNMGGPALHVAYLTAGLRARGYETTLVAGTLARGEDSMAFVADSLGVVVHTFHGHVLRGYFGPFRSRAFALLERLLARSTTCLVAVSPQVRDDLLG